MNKICRFVELVPVMAERVGFEPTCRSYRQTDFEGLETAKIAHISV